MFVKFFTNGHPQKVMSTKYNDFAELFFLLTKISSFKVRKLKSASSVLRTVMKVLFTSSLFGKFLRSLWYINPLQDEEGREGVGVGSKKVTPSLLYQFFPCNFYKPRVSPKNFQTFSFNPFPTLV